MRDILNFFADDPRVAEYREQFDQCTSIKWHSIFPWEFIEDVAALAISYTKLAIPESITDEVENYHDSEVYISSKAQYEALKDKEISFTSFVRNLKDTCKNSPFIISAKAPFSGVAIAAYQLLCSYLEEQNKISPANLFHHHRLLKHGAAASLEQKEFEQFLIELSVSWVTPKIEENTKVYHRPSKKKAVVVKVLNSEFYISTDDEKKPVRKGTVLPLHPLKLDKPKIPVPQSMFTARDAYELFTVC